MQIPTFVLERSRTLYENDVRINLTERRSSACDAGSVAADAGQHKAHTSATFSSDRVKNFCIWYRPANRIHLNRGYGGTGCN
jgi:hypothetical protein